MLLLWAVGNQFGQLNGPSPAVSAQELTAPEYRLKAAFLYNFAKLTEWPLASFPDHETKSPLVIGVLGKDPFGPELQNILRGKLIEGRAIEVRAYARVEEVTGCHLLFISASERDRLGAILPRLADRPILTVGETDGFAARGGIIGLVKERDEIRIEVNRRAAARAGVTLSSKLLRLARIVDAP